MEIISSSRPADSEVLTREQVTVLLRDSFRFLEGLEGCRVEVEDTAPLETIAYVFDDLSFEAHVDWRDLTPSFMVGRTVGGSRPPGYIVHEGLLVRIHMTDLLPTAPKPIVDRKRRRGKQPTVAERAERLTERIRTRAAALQASLPDVRAAALRLFAEADAASAGDRG